MRENRVKQKLANGEVAIGTTIFEFATSGIGRIAAEAGAEFVLFDLEHTTWSIETIRNLIAWSRAADIVPVVRPPATEYHLISGPLDAGAMGIMIPTVESVEQMELAVASCLYPPLGRRGCAFGISHDDYSGGDPHVKMAEANERVWINALIETPAGIRKVDAIAAVEGLDCLWVGLLDLSATLGVPGQFDHQDMEAAVDLVLSACRKHGKPAGVMVSSVENARMRIDQGFQALSFGLDITLYQQALRAGIAALREEATT